MDAIAPGNWEVVSCISTLEGFYEFSGTGQPTYYKAHGTGSSKGGAPIEKSLKPEPMYEKTVRRTIRFHELYKKIENIEGDVVECGVGTGRSFIILSTLVKQSDRRRKIFGFDTFTGFPDPKEVDQVSLRFIKKHRRKKFPPKEIVIQRMVNCGFDREWIDQNVTLLKGEFKDSLPNAPLKKLHFSTWTAISTKATWTVSISSTQK